jgi:hypothetical protein
MKYDDASWHFGGDFPEGSPREYGGTHIALLLRWCFLKGWAGPLHLDEEPDEVERVKSGRMSATEFLFKYCDGKFTDEDLNAEGNRFIEQYFGEKGGFLDDYAKNFGAFLYVAPESVHDFATFSSMMESRYRRFLHKSAQGS